MINWPPLEMPRQSETARAQNDAACCRRDRGKTCDLPMIAHPGTELLAGPVGEGIPQACLGRISGDGLEPQASAGIEQHREQRLAAADRRDP